MTKHSLTRPKGSKRETVRMERQKGVINRIQRTVTLDKKVMSRVDKMAEKISKQTGIPLNFSAVLEQTIIIGLGKMEAKL